MLIETQDPKNTNGNIGTTLQVGLSKDFFKSLHQPTIINVSNDKHNASPPSSMVDLSNTLINLTQNK